MSTVQSSVCEPVEIQQAVLPLRCDECTVERHGTVQNPSADVDTVRLALAEGLFFGQSVMAMLISKHAPEDVLESQRFQLDEIRRGLQALDRLEKQVRHVRR